MDDIINAVWPEKYRPTSIKHMVLPTTMRKYFNKIIETGIIPNMIFHSVKPGSGKTSAAKALCKDMDIDYLYENTSLNRGIDLLRDEITQYATTLSPVGGIKVVVLDEFDGAGDILQKALRASIEEFTETCRFILTCNNLNKIIEPIRSRCEPVDFNFTETKTREALIPMIYKRLCTILTTENIQYNDDTIKKISINYYPDIRSMVKLCQQFSTMHGMISDDIFNFTKIEDELANLIFSKKITAARKLIIDKGYDYDTLYRFIFDSVIPRIETPSKKALAIITVDEYMRGSRDSLDKEITFTACMVKLSEMV